MFSKLHSDTVKRSWKTPCVLASFPHAECDSLKRDFPGPVGENTPRKENTQSKHKAEAKMPEYSESDGETTTTIPNLFPMKLLDSCLNKVQEMVRHTGERVEVKAEKQAGSYRWDTS